MRNIYKKIDESERRRKSDDKLMEQILRSDVSSRNRRSKKSRKANSIIGRIAEDLGEMIGISDKVSPVSDNITDVDSVEDSRKLSLSGQLLRNKTDESTPRGEKGSTLNTLTAIRAVRELTKHLGEIGATLDDWDVRFTLDGFQIVNVKTSLTDTKAKEKIISMIKDAYPGARHDFDKNPNVFTFLAIHSDLGKTIRNKLGLQYEAFDDGSGNVGIVVKNPPIELPVEEDEEIGQGDVPQQPGAEMAPPPQEEEMGMGGGGGGMGGDMDMGGMGGDMGGDMPGPEGQEGEELDMSFLDDIPTDEEEEDGEEEDMPPLR